MNGSDLRDLVRAPAALCMLAVVVVATATSTLVRGDVYGIKSKSLSGSGPYQYEPPAILYKFEDDGSGLTSVGYITLSGADLRADGLAYVPGSGMYFFEPSGVGESVQSTLRSLDLGTAVAGTGITLPGRHIFAATVDSAGNLWALDQEQDELIRVEVATGQVLAEIGLSFDGGVFDLDGGAGDIAFDADGQAWITHEDDFYQIDTATGVMTLIHTQTGISLYMVGAAFSPLDASHLYVFDVSIGWNNDDLLRFDVDDGFSRYDVALRIFDAEFNAGRGDLEYVGVEQPSLVTVEPPADGTLPKTQNNVITLVFDIPITLPGGSPLTIVELADPNNDLSASFSYSIDPNDTGDPTGATLKATETGEVLLDETWYRVTPDASFSVNAFTLDFCTLRGDANNSARVTTADYSEVKAHMGERTDARYDLNGSARITTADYSVVKANMGHRAPAKP